MARRTPRVHRDTKSFLFDNEESAYPPQWPPGKRFSTVPLKRTETTTITDLPRSNNSTHVKSFIHHHHLFNAGEGGARDNRRTSGSLQRTPNRLINRHRFCCRCPPMKEFRSFSICGRRLRVEKLRFWNNYDFWIFLFLETCRWSRWKINVNWNNCIFSSI